MNDIFKVLLITSDTLMFIPLIVFCFIPVIQYRKSSLKKLILKIISAIIILEIIMFFIYLISVSEIATIINMCLITGGFFWLYQKEVSLPNYHLWFVFVTAGLIGSFGYMVYHISYVFMEPYLMVGTFFTFYPLISQVFFESILIIILYYPVKKYLSWLLGHFHEEKIWKIAWLFPASFIVLSRSLIPYDNGQLFTGRALEIYVIFLVIFLLIICFLYIMFFQVAYRMVEKQKILEKTNYLELQSEQYRRLQDHVQETKRIRHDFHHQLIVLERMLKSKDYEEAEEFLSAYSQDVEYVVSKYCSSPAINAILNHYVALCSEEKITAIFNVRLNDKGNLKDIDFCVLLGNLLENAVYACKELHEEGRKIELKIGQTTSNIIVVQITNPYVGIIKKDNEKFLSSRHSGEGQGIKSVRLITDKYNGFIKVSDDNQLFVVRVLLNI